MSYPNLLEYHLLSSRPLMDSSPSVSSLQKRFAYALRYLSYPKYFYNNMLTKSFTDFNRLLHYVLRGFRYPTVQLFLPQKCRFVSSERFTMCDGVSTCGQKYYIIKAVLKERGFKPISFGKKS